ncbi:MAG: nitrile hydratase subunit beta [Pseudomonadota bacterium]
MNGGADLGGMQGFGPVVPEEDEPVFHAEWEKRSFALTVALGATGTWNIDTSRHARESLPPGEYLTSSYYRIWARGIERLMVSHNMATKAEIEAGKSTSIPKELTRVLTKDNVAAVLSKGGPADRPSTEDPKFTVGQSVRTANLHPSGHTRLPRYAREKTGTVSAIIGHHVFPDSNAAGTGEDPQWLYTVTFLATELWGSQANPRDKVHVDIWEPHLVAG